MNRARNADHAAKTCERFVYSIVNNKIVWLSNMADTFFLWRNVGGAQRNVGFFLDCAFRMLIGWTGKLHTLLIKRPVFFIISRREKVPSKCVVPRPPRLAVFLQNPSLQSPIILWEQVWLYQILAEGADRQALEIRRGYQVWVSHFERGGRELSKNVGRSSINKRVNLEKHKEGWRIFMKCPPQRAVVTMATTCNTSLY